MKNERAGFRLDHISQFVPNALDDFNPFFIFFEGLVKYFLPLFFLFIELIILRLHLMSPLPKDLIDLMEAFRDLRHLKSLRLGQHVHGQL